jgi:hypothetical protein
MQLALQCVEGAQMISPMDQCQGLRNVAEEGGFFDCDVASADYCSVADEKVAVGHGAYGYAAALQLFLGGQTVGKWHWRPS